LVHGPKNVRAGLGFSCWRFCALAGSDDGTLVIGDRVSLNLNV
jgi:hypothetical protein